MSKMAMHTSKSDHEMFSPKVRSPKGSWDEELDLDFGGFIRCSSEPVDEVADQVTGERRRSPIDTPFAPKPRTTSDIDLRCSERRESSPEPQRGFQRATTMPVPNEPTSPKEKSPKDYYAGSSRSAKDGAIHCAGFTTRKQLTASARGLVIVLVGLPGRGKSFISRKMEGFLQWQCMRTKVFNVGMYRRDGSGAEASGRADFFASTNEAAKAAREDAARACLDDLLQFLNDGGHVGIFDATNSTNERRQSIVNRVSENEFNYRVVFVEVVCDDPEVLQTNLRNKVMNSPDFEGMPIEEAMADMQERVRKYEERYQTIEDDRLSYIKLYNMSSKVLVNRIYGSVAKSLMPYLMAVHIGTRPIFLCRAGHVPASQKQDSILAPAGNVFAEKLGRFLHRRLVEFYDGQVPEDSLKCMASTQTSAVQTMLYTLTNARCLHQAKTGHAQRYKKSSTLNAIDRGRLDGSWWVDLCSDKPPFDELKRRDPEFHARWEQNKLRARFPGGESYFDVMQRVESSLLDMEMSTQPVLCMSHMTPLQVLVCYFKGEPLDTAWDVPVPLHSVFEVIPTLGGGYTVNMITEEQLTIAALSDPEVRGTTWESEPVKTISSETLPSETRKGIMSRRASCIL